MRRFDRGLAWASGALLALGAILMGIMALHVVIDVIGRAFKAPLPGTVEMVSRYYMVGVIFLPLAYVQSRRAHIATDQFIAWMPRRALEIVTGCVGILGTIVLLVLAWRGLGEAIRTTALNDQAVTGDISLITWPARWFVPLGLGTMAAQTLVQGVRDLIGRSTGTGSMVGTTTPGATA